MSHLSFKSIALSAVLTLAAIAPIGCEERVVGVDNAWGGSVIDRRNRQEEQEQSGKHLENLGNFLFGWTDGLTGKTKKPVERDYYPQ